MTAVNFSCLLWLTTLIASTIANPVLSPYATLKILPESNDTYASSDRQPKWISVDRTSNSKDKKVFLEDSFVIPSGCGQNGENCKNRSGNSDVILESGNIFPDDGGNSMESDNLDNSFEMFNVDLDWEDETTGNTLDSSSLLKNVFSQSELQEVLEDANVNSTRAGRGLLTHAFSFLDLKQAIHELETSVMTSVSCTACKAGVGLLQHYIATKRSVKDIIAAATKVCESLKIETPRVCHGIISLLAGEVVYVMQYVVLNPEEVCGLLLGDACAHPVNPFHNWLVQLPPIPKPPVQPPLPPKSGSPQVKVLHLSDTHYDPYYLPGSNADCGEPLCCRGSNGPAFLSSKAAGKWGDYRKCDAPLRTIESMLANIAEKHPDISYILWTGDLPPHDVWNQTKSYNLGIIRDTVEQLVKHFPKTPIFPALGNHESVPVNSFPPPFTPEQFANDWLYEELNKQWGRWLPLSTAPTIRRGAFYSVLVETGFRIISINTNYCNNKNWWLILNSTDPASELQWLVYELQAAEFNNEKVHIIGHIPPGYADCLRVWSYNYYRIVNRYESTIAAQFFGHTHYDEFEVFYDLEDPRRPVSIAFIGPSVTPYYGLNPGYRIYHVDGDYKGSTKMVLDHETWIMDLVSANKYDRPEWFRLYSASSQYGIPNAFPEHWDELVKRMIHDDELFYMYYRFYWKNSPAREPCGQKCKMRILCDLVSGRSHDRVATCSHLETMNAVSNRRSWTSVLFNGLATVYVGNFFTGFSWLSSIFGAFLG